ncbi:site-specific integrase [Paenibacillus alvei]
MPKKKKIFTIEEDLRQLIIDNAIEIKLKTEYDEMKIEDAFAIILRQMEVSGLRERTIRDYKLHVNHYIKATGAVYLDEISVETIYEWLETMVVSDQTRNIRLKCFKAFLGKCFSNGWIRSKFWDQIKIRVDNKLKKGATDQDVNLLLSVLDLKDFVQLRDATATLIMYKTGIRVGTLAQLRNKHINFSNDTMELDGEIMKNRESLLLPFDPTLKKLLSTLMKQNEMIRKEYGTRNSYVFITKQGTTIKTEDSNNNLQKRLYKYSKQYGIKNINPHALRRGFATNLLSKGANITVISKALGHSDISVTSKYLYIDKQEVVSSLRRFL